MLNILTYVDVQPSLTSQAIGLLRQYRETSSAEEGNSSIDVLQEAWRPNRFVIIEGWKDESSFQSHERTEHTEQFRSNLRAIHNSPYDQRVHHQFAVGPDPKPAPTDALFVVTHVDVPPPRKDETELLLKTLAEKSRKEEGSVRYDVFQQRAPRTNHFSVFAVWNDEKALTSHEMKPHCRQFREELGPMLGAPYDERLYRHLEAAAHLRHKKHKRE